MKGSLVYYVVALLIGTFLNSLPELFESEGLINVGGAAAILITLCFSWRWSLPAVIIIYSPLWLTGENLLALGFLTLQPLLLLLPSARKVSLFFPIKRAGVYWSIAAVLPLWFFAWILQQQPWSSALTGTTVTLLSGWVALILGYFAAPLLRLPLHRPMTQPSPVSSAFAFVFAGVFFLSVVFITYSYIALFQQEQKSEIVSYLGHRAQTMASQVDSFLSDHRQTLLMGADLLSSAALEKQPQTVLSSIGNRQHDFLTLLVTDNKGTIISAYPQALFEKAQREGQTDVSNRAYFTEVSRTQQLYISDVFKGRGFGNDPIVAISAPYWLPSGEWGGIIEGSLSLDSFGFIDAQNLPGFHLLIRDARHSVIYGSAALGVAPLQSLLFDQQEASPLLVYNGIPWLWKALTLNDAGWTMILFYDYRRYLQQTEQYILASLGWLVVISGVGILLGISVARIITRPLRVLTTRIHAFDPRLLGKEFPLDEVVMLREVNSLQTSFGALQKRLSDAFGARDAAIEEQRRLNRELAELNSSLSERVAERTASLHQALQQAKSAAEAKSMFLANMSHELRTPMNGILGTCDNLLGSDVLGAENARKVQLLQRSAEHLSMILDAILDWSKIESGNLALVQGVFNLAEVVDACYQLHLSAAEQKHLKLHYSGSASLPTAVVGDVVRFNQILHNLMSNAIKFTLKGDIYFSVGYSQGFCVISVSDTGIGMTPEQQARIFDQFIQGDESITRQFGGTGLGMAITKNIVELMQGNIEVSSQYGVGSCFEVLLPLPLSTDSNEAHPSNLPTPLITGKHVLVVEDNDINAEIVSDMLRSAGASVDWAENGQIALDMLSKHAPDIILMDCQMPIMDGYETTKHIRAGKAAVPIIALTANAFPEDRDACMQAGMDDFIAKPVRKHVLLAKLALYLSRDNGRGN